MWSTSAKLQESFRLIEFWGLQFITVIFIYSKTYKYSKRYVLGFGHYTRNNCEFLILCKKGSISKFLRNSHNVG